MYLANSHHSQSPAIAAAQHMDMGAASGTLEHSCHKDSCIAKGVAANGTNSWNMLFQAIHTSADMHQAVYAAGDRRINHGSDQVAFFEM